MLKRCIEEYDDNPTNKYKWYRQKIRSQYNIDDNDSHQMYKYLGTYIENDFNLNYYEGKIRSLSVPEEEKSPLKYFIKELLRTYKIDENMYEEIEELKKLKDKMITVITTNYDTFLEDHIFTNHERLIKQKMFVYSELGTLFKIHGCISEPSSIVLTYQDYENFNKKSKVLSAKVISLFAENPVIFMGYSITDENIRNFLKDIYTCLENEEEYKAFEDRLVIIEYKESVQNPIIGSHSVYFDGVQIKLTKIIVEDFTLLYKEMQKLEDIVELKDIKRLRNLVYQIVYDYKGEAKKVINLLDDEEYDGNEVVVAIGKESELLDVVGITGISAKDIFKDLVFDSLDSKLKNRYDYLVEKQLPQLLRGNTVLPVHKYLQKIENESVIIDEKVRKMAGYSPEDLLNNNIKKDREAYLESKFSSLEEIVNSNLPSTKKLNFLVLRAALHADDKELKSFLRTHYKEFESYRFGPTMLRKMICILDIKAYKSSA
ncbi:hypothetical protein B4113_0090 [Geobacillus sp. B4113_201601]|nr:hypothetical protein B4113_0090 [Geobacillus sp. B4113_201601]